MRRKKGNLRKNLREIGEEKGTNNSENLGDQIKENEVVKRWKFGEEKNFFEGKKEAKKKQREEEKKRGKLGFRVLQRVGE